jgi:hypothetical protein
MWELVLNIRAITFKGVRYGIETAEGTSRGAGFEPKGAAVITTEGPTRHVHTSGRRINVPAGTVLKFQTAERIRLRDYQTFQFPADPFAWARKKELASPNS